ncbi:two-component system response regulator ArlR [Paenibacillus sp. PastF-1]|nr:two-component system response regulator ArlR [Paenibacillus sp. PastF-2]MDF9849080.1 two-component system response regulator ArlR [Paenibacillus sp. PastM-2]MDF9855650.1 two-component system response regulator ArlR [Paenibacillus sp. PastF-1]MDH6480922.1 two-component system response regulator ArlR [Paenibacillus sp. PastH-2]MDH6508344.1 two-component system response regulator ArlR [Paenibacillus sp. PastM-3]
MSMKEHVLIIEDEAAMVRLLELELAYEGYEITVARDGLAGAEQAVHGSYDLILLDLNLPGINGIEVCKRIRAVKQTPIIMITARDTVSERVRGLDTGADDYVPKPFAIEELLARMRSLQRRLQQSREPVDLLEAKDLTLSAASHRVTRAGQDIELSQREFELLRCLLQNKNRLMNREALLNLVWGYSYEGETNVVDVYIRYLRMKVDEGYADKLIHTVRGSGYILRD